MPLGLSLIHISWRSPARQNGSLPARPAFPLHTPMSCRPADACRCLFRPPAPAAGRWADTPDVYKRQGKSCDKWESFPTKEEAVKRQKQIEHELATGNFLIPSTAVSYTHLRLQVFVLVKKIIRCSIFCILNRIDFITNRGYLNIYLSVKDVYKRQLITPVKP